MHGVLNIDEIKNYLHSLVVLCETNVLSLISQRLDNYYQIQTNATVRYSNSDGANFGQLNKVLVLAKTISTCHAWKISTIKATCPRLP